MKKKKLFSLALSVALVLSTVVMPINVIFGAESDSGMVSQTETERQVNANDISSNADKAEEVDESLEHKELSFVEEDFTWTLDEDGTLIIFDIEEENVDLDTDQIAGISDKVTKIIFITEEDVDCIDFPWTFSFPNLKKLCLPKKVRELQGGMIGENLEEITGGDDLEKIWVDLLEGTPWLEKQGTVAILGKILIKYMGSDETYIVPDYIKMINHEAFSGCKSLKKITLPESSLKEIGQNAFWGCSALTTVVGGDSVTEIGHDAFSYTPWLENHNGEVVFGTTLFRYEGDEKNYVIPRDVTIIGRCAFLGNHVIETVEIGEKVFSIQDSAFCACDNLKEVILSDSVETIGEDAFRDCTSLVSVYGGKNVTDVHRKAFSGTPWLDNLKGAVILGGMLLQYEGNDMTYCAPDYVEGIGADAFIWNENIELVDLSQSNISEIPCGAFSDCSNLKNILLPDSVKSIGEEAFYGTSLQEIKLPNSLTHIGSGAFAGTSLQEIELPALLTYVGSSAFAGCDSLSRVNFGSKIGYIGPSAFEDTPWIESQGDAIIVGDKLFSYVGENDRYRIPDSIVAIGVDSFAGTYLEEVVFNSKITTIPEKAFHRSWVSSVQLSTSVTTIEKEAFIGCNDLYSMVIPKTVTTIGERAIGYGYEMVLDEFCEEQLVPVKCADFIIYGEPGTEAERYAKENKITFISTVTEKPSLTDADVTASVADQVYTGEALTPAVTVKYGTKELKKDTDYTVSYKNNISPGKATVTITGKGNYTGTKEVTFTIAQKAVKELAATLEYTETTYTGNALTPVVTVKYGTKVLKKDTDYTVAYKNNVNPGKATVTITGKGNYTGTKEVTFTIAQKAVKELAATLEYTETTYTGEALTPPVTVKYGTKELKKDTDYTVSYKNNISPGKATVTITGKGNYAGTKTLTFTIAEGTVSVKSSTNTAGKPQLTWSPVKGASKYVIYRSGTSTGTYKKMHTTTGTSYTNTSAGVEYTYFYKVQALDKNGKVIATSSIVKQKCITTTSAVLTVKGGNSDSGKPRLTWNKVPGASKYVIYRSGTSNGTYTKMFDTDGTSYTNTSAGVGYTYFYKVQALDKNGKVIAKSSIVKQKCITAVLTVKGGNSDSGKPRLTWSKMSGASKYVIYRSGTSTGTYKKMHTTTGTSYTNTTAGAGYTYFYKVQALDKSGKVIATSSIVKQKCITAVLTVKGGNSDSGKPRLTWSKVSGASKYVIYRSGTSTGTYKKMHTTTGTSYTNTSANGGYTYYYGVQALDKNGKVIAKSSTVKQLCKLSKPKITKGNNSAGKPKLTWNKVSGASKYVVYRSGTSNGTYKQMYTTTGTSYTNTSAGAGYTYFYKVVAVSKNNTNANATSQIVKQKCLSSGVKITKGNATSGKPKLSWKKVSGAKKYEVYRSGYKNGTYTKMYTTEGTSYTNTSAKKGYSYYYKVKAIGTDTFVESNLVSVKCR